ncbi:hypothetical protein [Azospirillum griseum]|nr:hypothetical protein [Azospirillum griseum]
MKAMLLGFAAALLVAAVAALVLTGTDLSSATRFSSTAVRL